MNAHLSRWTDRLRGLPGARVLLRRRYDRYFVHATNEILFRGVYPTFGEAQAAVPSGRPAGYDHADAAAMFREFLDKILPADYPPLFWLARALDEGARSVFDFGGHVGVKYHAFSRYIQYPPDFRWTVCELPAVTRAGMKLAAQRGATSLDFVNEPAAADGYDVFYSSGALQFVEPSLPTLLEPLVSKPPHVIVNSTAYTDHPTFYTVQKTTCNAYCAHKIEQLPPMLERMERMGYRLVDRWLNPVKNCVVPHHPGYAVRGYTGLYFRRN